MNKWLVLFIHRAVSFSLWFIGKDEASEIEMTIPGLDWGMEEVMQKDQKKVPQKKVPYAKPIPAQFQQVRDHVWLPYLQTPEGVLALLIG